MRYFFIAFLTLLNGAHALSGDSLTLYTSRKTHLIQPLLDQYEKKTGIQVKHINGKAGSLIERIKQESTSTNADLLITVDAGNLAHAAKLGLLQPIENEKWLDSIPSRYRGHGNQWVGLSLRARTLFYNKNLVNKKDLKNYEDLAEMKWKKKLCLRTSRKVYNQSLVAALIERHGEEKTKKIVEGWVQNLAKPVYTSDSLLLKAIDKGTCAVGIANTYYLARMVKKGEAQNVGVFWPASSHGGVHINVSGAGIVKNSKNKKEALRFLAWLTESDAQNTFASLNDEYPVIDNIPISPVLKTWGKFSSDPIPLSKIGASQKRAVLLMDKARYR